MGEGLMGLFGATAITIGLLLIALRLLKRLDRRTVGTGRVPIRILDRLPLGTKQGLILVQVGRRVLVLGSAEPGPRLLTELRGEDRLAALEDRKPEPRVSKDPELRRLLSRLTLSLVIACFPGTGALHGQAPKTKAPTSRAVAISPPTSVAPAKPGPTASARATKSPRVDGPAAPVVDVRIGQGADQLKLSGTVGLVVFMGALTLLPAVVLLMTSFTRILVVLHFLRSAIGTQGSPPGQLLVAIAVLLTGVVMHPVIEEANKVAIQPYFDGKIEQAEAYRLGVQPFRRFMLANVREKDLTSFANMSGIEATTEDDLPTLTIVTAFVTSELQTAFWMGFVIFLPFVVVDLLVATALMSLGMFMVPPVMISLPFKLLLFVLADGWALIGQNLVASFNR